MLKCGKLEEIMKTYTNTKTGIAKLAKKAISHCQNVAVGKTSDNELYYYNYAGNQHHSDEVFYHSSTHGLSAKRLELEILNNL